jgi:hypothetical protein
MYTMGPLNTSNKLRTADRRPDLFIVGAPKCGTTALFNYLGDHPDIYMSTLKEPQYFAEDIFGPQRNVTNLDEYLRCFGAARNQRCLGEGSTCYLASPSAAQKIQAFSPHARIIIMLRDPLEVMHAEHNQRVLNDMEQILDFARALESRDARVWGSGPFQGQAVIRPSYREITQFATQTKRYFEVFGRDKVLVIIYEDFKANPAEVYAGALRFLDLPAHPRSDFPVANESRRVRSTALRRFVRYSPSGVRRIARLLLPPNARRAIYERLHKVAIVPAPRPRLDPELRRRLQRECAPEIHRLSALLHRDLSAWCVTG